MFYPTIRNPGIIFGQSITSNPTTSWLRDQEPYCFFGYPLICSALNKPNPFVYYYWEYITEGELYIYVFFSSQHHRSTRQTTAPALMRSFLEHKNSGKLHGPTENKFYQTTELGTLSQTTNLYFPFSKSPGNCQSSHNILSWSQAHSRSCVKIINYFVNLMAVKYWQNLRCRVVRHE